MAKNNPVGDSARVGAVRDRSQTFNSKTSSYANDGSTRDEIQELASKGE
jgi:hypothetical protein